MFTARGPINKLGKPEWTATQTPEGIMVMVWDAGWPGYRIVSPETTWAKALDAARKAAAEERARWKRK